MQPSTIRRLMASIADIDETVRPAETYIPLLQKKLIPVERYSRTRLFEHMAKQQPALFHSFPVPVRGDSKGSIREVLLRHLKASFPGNWKTRALVNQKERYLPIPRIIDHWTSSDEVFGVTDLHIRGTKMEKLIDTENLTNFNVLLCGSKAMAAEEMLTFVISSRGNVTDSHSDAPDGSNHCFVGKKLWLMWETFEGLSRGLEDAERVDVHAPWCKFDLATFLSLESSRWLVISTRQTLFLPGHLTHKVYTLEPYLGVGCFYLGLPNCIQTLARWRQHGPLWAKGERVPRQSTLIGEIADTANRKVRETRVAPRRVQKKWGLDEMDKTH